MEVGVSLSSRPSRSGFQATPCVARSGAAVRIRLALILLAAAACGCASATKRFEQGAELEAQGRYAEAAERYIQALRKDPGMPGARQHLADLGPRIIADRMAEADGYAASGFQIQRAESYRAIDDFVAATAGVGVPLPLPPGYHDKRRAGFDAAIAQLGSSGERAESEGRWGDAIHAYEQVPVYEPGARQAESARVAQGHAWLSWAEADLGAGHCRDALEHAGRALAMPGGLPPAAGRRAEELRAEALVRGTVHVALVPVRGSKGASLPAEFLSELNDELELEHWSQPPVFVAVIDPRRVRHELRAQDCMRGTLTARQAARVGRALGADIALCSEITSLVTREENVQLEIRRVHTRAGVDTTYVVRKGKRYYDLAATYALVDVGQGREASRQTLEASESQDFQEGVFAGDPSQLQLASTDRGLFDTRKAREEEQDIESRLITQATGRLAERVYADILSRVP